MKEHVPLFTIDRNLTRRFLKSEWHVVWRRLICVSARRSCMCRHGHIVRVLPRRWRGPLVGAWHHAQKAVCRTGGVDVDREGHRRPDIAMRPALPVRVPTDPAIARILPAAGILVHYTKTRTLQQMPAPNPLFHQFDNCWMKNCRPGTRCNLRDVLNVIGETPLLVDTIIKQNAVSELRIQRAGNDAILCFDALSGDRVEFLIGIESAKDGEAVVMKKIRQFLQLVLTEHADFSKRAKVRAHRRILSERSNFASVFSNAAAARQRSVLLRVTNRRSEERRVGKECRSRWSP